MDWDALSQGEAIETAHAVGAGDGGVANGPLIGVAAEAPRATSTYVTAPAAAGAELSGYAGFLAEVAGSLAFIRKPGNIVLFVVLWFVLIVREVAILAAPFTGYILLVMTLLAILILTGWYQAFRMNIVAWSAGGEDDLPELSISGDWWDDIILPCLRMVAAYIFSFLPFWLLAGTLYLRMCNAVAANPGLLGGGKSSVVVPDASAVVLLAAFYLVGKLVWPIAVLVVSCGSAGGLLQLDLIVATVAKTLPAYLLTVVAVCATDLLGWLATAYIMSQGGDEPIWKQNLATFLLLPLVVVGAKLYFDIVAMRAIGSYYRFFKGRFAWDWG